MVFHSGGEYQEHYPERSYFVRLAPWYSSLCPLGFPVGKVLQFLLLRQVDYFVGGGIYLLVKTG